MAKTVLVVDDDPTQRRLIQAVLERDGFMVVQAESGDQALGRLAMGGVDVMILDLVMPGRSGLETLAEARATGVTTPVVVLTATGGIDTVVKAMQAGAQDFFVKPASPERILVSVRNALSVGDLTAEVKRLQKRSSGATGFDDLVGTSGAMDMVRRLGTRAAKANIPVLILGESGVGKELIARAVHGASDRAGKPFVAVNCGALPENLVESVLFGHEKGAFTGASDKHLGKFAEANGGTLFLDEIGELPLEMQVKLLRALQEGEIDPVGSKKPVKVDVRIVSATNRDLAVRAAQGHFREDLYYRLNVFPIEAPPLRDRREDVPALVAHFISRINAQEGLKILGATPQTLEMLVSYDWPGNVRQLENSIYRAMVLADAPYLTPHDFPALSGLKLPLHVSEDARGLTRAISDANSQAASLVSASFALGGRALETLNALPQAPSLPAAPIAILDGQGHLRKLEEIERDLIQHAIEIYAGHMSEVARRLGIGRSTLYRKVRENGLEGLLKEG